MATTAVSSPEGVAVEARFEAVAETRQLECRERPPGRRGEGLEHDDAEGGGGSETGANQHRGVALEVGAGTVQCRGREQRTVQDAALNGR